MPPLYRKVEARKCCDNSVVEFFNFNFDVFLNPNNPIIPVSIFDQQFVFPYNYNNEGETCWKVVKVYNGIDNSIPYVDSEVFKKCAGCIEDYPCNSFFRTRYCGTGSVGPTVEIIGSNFFVDGQGDILQGVDGNVIEYHGKCLYLAGPSSSTPQTIQASNFLLGCDKCELPGEKDYLYRVRQICCDLHQGYGQTIQIAGDEGGEIGNAIFFQNACWEIIFISQPNNIPSIYPYYTGVFYDGCPECINLNNLPPCSLYFRTLKCKDNTVGPIVTVDQNLLETDANGNIILDSSGNVFIYDNDCYYLIGEVPPTAAFQVTEFTGVKCAACRTTDGSFTVYRARQICCEYHPGFGTSIMYQGNEGGELGQFIFVQGACWEIYSVFTVDEEPNLPVYFGNFTNSCDDCFDTNPIIPCERFDDGVWIFENCCNREDTIRVKVYDQIPQPGDGVWYPYVFGDTPGSSCYVWTGELSLDDTWDTFSNPNVNQLNSNFCDSDLCGCPGSKITIEQKCCEFLPNFGETYSYEAYINIPIVGNVVDDIVDDGCWIVTSVQQLNPDDQGLLETIETSYFTDCPSCFEFNNLDCEPSLFYRIRQVCCEDHPGYGTIIDITSTDTLQLGSIIFLLDACWTVSQQLLSSNQIEFNYDASNDQYDGCVQCFNLNGLECESYPRVVTFKPCCFICDPTIYFATVIVQDDDIELQPGSIIFTSVFSDDNEGECFMIEEILEASDNPNYPSIVLTEDAYYQGSTYENNCKACNQSNSITCDTTFVQNCTTGLFYEIQNLSEGLEIGTFYYFYNSIVFGQGPNGQNDLDFEPSLFNATPCFKAVENDCEFNVYGVLNASAGSSTIFEVSNCLSTSCILPTPTPTPTLTHTPELTRTPAVTSTITQTETPTHTPTNTGNFTPEPTPTFTQTPTHSCEAGECNKILIEKYVLCGQEPFVCDEGPYVFNNRTEGLYELFGVQSYDVPDYSFSMDNDVKLIPYAPFARVKIKGLWTAYLENNETLKVVTDDNNYYFRQGKQRPLIGGVPVDLSFEADDGSQLNTDITGGQYIYGASLLWSLDWWYYNTLEDRYYGTFVKGGGPYYTCLTPNQPYPTYSYQTFYPRGFSQFGSPCADGFITQRGWITANRFKSNGHDFCHTINKPMSELWTINLPSDPTENQRYIVDADQVFSSEFLRSSGNSNLKTGFISKCGYDSFILEFNYSPPTTDDDMVYIGIGGYLDSQGLYGIPETLNTLEIRIDSKDFPDWYGDAGGVGEDSFVDDPHIDILYNDGQELNSFRNPDYINADGDFYYEYDDTDPSIEPSYSKLVRRFDVPEDYYIRNYNGATSRIKIEKELEIIKIYITKAWDANTLATLSGEERDFYLLGTINLFNPEISDGSQDGYLMKHWADQSLLQQFVNNSKWGLSFISYEATQFWDFYFSGTQVSNTSVLYRYPTSFDPEIGQTYFFENYYGCYEYQGLEEVNPFDSLPVVSDDISGPYGTCDDCDSGEEPLLNCSDSFTTISPNFSSPGVYNINVEVGNPLGEVTLIMSNNGVPCRFQVFWNGELESDSLFIGDDLYNDPSSQSYANEIDNLESLDQYNWNGSEFVSTSNVEYFDFNSSPGPNSSYPLENDLRINGNSGLQIGVVPDFPNIGSYPAWGSTISLKFTKYLPLSTNLLIKVICPFPGTFNIESVSCPLFQTTPNPSFMPTPTHTPTPTFTPTNHPEAYTRFIHIPNLPD